MMMTVLTARVLSGGGQGERRFLDRFSAERECARVCFALSLPSSFFPFTLSTIFPMILQGLGG